MAVKTPFTSINIYQVGPDDSVECVKHHPVIKTGA